MSDTQKLTEQEVQNYIEQNKLTFHEKILLDTRESILNLRESFGKTEERININDKKIEELKNKHDTCPALDFYMTGRSLVKAGKAIPRIITFVVAAIAAAASFFLLGGSL